jgi:hypothetical protein
MNSIVVCTFGRFNPPTIGHEKLINKVAEIARRERADYYIFPSPSGGKVKDPLELGVKVKYMKKMFPSHASQIVFDKSINTPWKMMTYLNVNLNYRNVIMVAGSDRVPEYESKLSKDNGRVDTPTPFRFGEMIFESAGERDPDADGAEGMSASKMRAAAKDLKTKDFASGIPNTLTLEEKLDLMHLVRGGMGL